jgi:hypothetical protein
MDGYVRISVHPVSFVVTNLTRNESLQGLEKGDEIVSVGRPVGTGEPNRIEDSSLEVIQERLEQDYYELGYHPSNKEFAIPITVKPKKKKKKGFGFFGKKKAQLHPSKNERKKINKKKQTKRKRKKTNKIKKKQTKRRR